MGMLRVYMGLIKDEDAQFDVEWQYSDGSPIDLTGFDNVFWSIWTNAYSYLASREDGLIIDDELGFISMYLSLDTMEHFRINSFGYHKLYVDDGVFTEVIIEGGVFIHGG